MILLAKSIKSVPDLKYLNSLALKYIFDKSHLTLDEEHLLNDGIENWVRKVDLQPYEKSELQAIVKCLLHDKKGGYDKEKFAWKKGNIDYRKVYSEGI